MNTTKSIYQILPALASLALGACGIDQGGAPAPTPSSAKASVTYGPIEAFGSIILNGETIDTATATILVNDLPATDADLRVGQLVRVISLTEDDSAIAQLIEYRPNLSGPVDAVNASTATLAVLGREIEVATNAALDVSGVTTLGDVPIGSFVEVSALQRPDGTLLATFIGTAPTNSLLEIGTSITAVDLAAMRFSLGPLSVDYSQANLIEVQGGQPAVGQIVLVSGVSFSNAGELIADQVIELETQPGLFSAIDTDFANPALSSALSTDVSEFDANFIGFITTSNNASTLSVNDITVSFDATTIINGGTATDLDPSTLVQIRGEVTATGEVSALQITIL